MSRGQRGVAEHDRDDRVLAGLELEARAVHAGAEVRGVVAQPLRAARRSSLEQVEHRDGRRRRWPAASVLEKRYGRERWRSSRSSRWRPAT